MVNQIRKEYPWWASFDEMIQFEAENPENWICDVPQLDKEDVTKLVEDCMIRELLPAMRLLEQAIKQNELSGEKALEAFHYVQEVFCNLLLCFGAITLAQALSTEDLIVIASLFDDNDDPYVHSLGNLAGRIPHDAMAWEFLKQESTRITEPMIKDWLAPILRKHATDQCG